MSAPEPAAQSAWVAASLLALMMASRRVQDVSTTVSSAVEVTQIEPPNPALNRFFYENVGAQWNWHDKLPWTEEQWRSYAMRPELKTWVGYLSGQPFGYFELEEQPEADVEIKYFGLLPGFTGCGLGGQLLTEAIRRAWAMGASRVWLHTCSHDHPAALPNYQARGFTMFKQEEQQPKDTPPATGVP